jgi:hypothetical protein
MPILTNRLKIYIIALTRFIQILARKNFISNTILNRSLLTKGTKLVRQGLTRSKVI